MSTSRRVRGLPSVHVKLGWEGGPVSSNPVSTSRWEGGPVTTSSEVGRVVQCPRQAKVGGCSCVHVKRGVVLY